MLDPRSHGETPPPPITRVSERSSGANALKLPQFEAGDLFSALQLALTAAGSDGFWEQHNRSRFHLCAAECGTPGVGGSVASRLRAQQWLHPQSSPQLGYEPAGAWNPLSGSAALGRPRSRFLLSHGVFLLCSLPA